MVNVEFSQAGVGEHTVLRQRQWAPKGVSRPLSFFLSGPEAVQGSVVMEF